MNQRENFFAMLEGKKPEFSPMVSDVYKLCLLATNNADQPWQPGVDPFGINWVGTPEGVIPEPNNFMFSDVADWKKYVRIPDVDSLGIEQMAQIELEGFVRGEQVVNVYSTNGLFERLVTFIGFEETLCALLEDPDSCHEFFEAIADYKIAVHNRIIDTYKPDVITYFDDLATDRGLFMSPKTYREVIKPHHQRIVEAVTSRGVIFAQHTCGKCEDIVEDYIEMGVKIWSSAQIKNDLEGIMEKYHGRLIVEGGWNPMVGFGVTLEDLIEEATRCAKQYGKSGNYICLPMIITENGNALISGDERIPTLMAAWNKVNKLS